jgi:hypothetical protein
VAGTTTEAADGRAGRSLAFIDWCVAGRFAAWAAGGAPVNEKATASKASTERETMRRARGPGKDMLRLKDMMYLLTRAECRRGLSKPPARHLKREQKQQAVFLC